MTEFDAAVAALQGSEELPCLQAVPSRGSRVAEDVQTSEKERERQRHAMFILVDLVKVFGSCRFLLM